MFDFEWHSINDSTDALRVPHGIILRIATTAGHVAMTFVPMPDKDAVNFLAEGEAQHTARTAVKVVARAPEPEPEIAPEPEPPRAPEPPPRPRPSRRIA